MQSITKKVEGKTLPRRVGPGQLAKLVGPAPFLSARLGTEPHVGVSLGLAYTGAGGDVLRIECVVTPGKGDFHLTGQLGEIMQESVTAAWGYLKTAILREGLGDLWQVSPGRAYLADHFTSPEPVPLEGGGLAETSLREVSATSVGEGLELADECEAPGPSDHELLSALEVRIHLPEGAVPKEGPSAGLAMAVSLLSALTQIPLVPRVALSGEITLTGQILPVGGLKEKLLAALREGVRKVVLPEGVRPQVRELPAELARGLEIVYVKDFSEVLPHVLALEEEALTDG